MRPNRWFVGLAFILWALTPAAVLLSAMTGIWPFLTIIVHSVMFGTMAYAYGTRSLKRARAEEGTLALDAEFLRLSGRPVVRRSEIIQAFVVPHEKDIFVRLERKEGRPLFVRVKDDAQARSLVASLGLDASRCAAALTVASQVHAMSIPRQMVLFITPLFVIPPLIFLATQLFPRDFAPVLVGLVALFLGWVFGVAFMPTSVRIGTDGIVTKWFHQKRFYPHTRIKTVERYREFVTNKLQYGVKVTLTDGEVVKIPTGQSELAEQEAARLCERIEDARAQGGGSTASTTEALARSDRTVRDWVRALRQLGDGAVGLRTAAVPRDQILRILEDGTAQPIDRASAAVAALSAVEPHEREHAKARVRVAAETAASPQLRVALVRIAESFEDEQAIGSVLEELGRR